MIIRKLALPRRTFLRGVGVALALPALDAMVPGLSALAPSVTPKRLGYLYLPNGVAMNHAGINFWKPEVVGRIDELSTILKPLEPFRNQLTVVSGLAHFQAESLGDGNGDHTRSTATWLNGVHPKFTQGSDLRAGVTADQVAAAELGQETAIPSLELSVDVGFVVGNCDNGYSCAYQNTLSWRNPTTPNPTETNPRAVFERLFGDGGSPTYRLAQARKDASILDAITDQMKRFQMRLGASDRAKTTDFFESIREVERRIQKAEDTLSTDSVSAPELASPVGIPDVYGDYVKLMFDLQWLAFQTDSTRVFTFMYGREQNSRTYPEIGMNRGHHTYSHHQDRLESIKEYIPLNVYTTELFAHFLAKLKSTPEGDGTLLDHSLILYGAGMSNPNIHSHVDIPLVMVGGAPRASGALHLAYPMENRTPMTNLLVSMLDKSGIAIERLGDSTGRVELVEPLTGV
jgi:hypothetical protein